jgi:sugar O-acyltransferase (sialic acid O-acetyltransferase NeuD family)
MKKQLVLIGGGGHCKSCIDVVESTDAFVISGILDPFAEIGSELLGYKVLGDDRLIPELAAKGCSFLITVGQIKSAALRRKLFHALVARNIIPATVIAATARVSKYASIGAGTIVMHGVQVNAGAAIGANVILNTGSLVEHDALVGDHVHLSTQAVLNGAVTVSDNCFIGSNAVIAQGINIIADSVIGAGAVVVRNIEAAGVYAGNPARIIN